MATLLAGLSLQSPAIGVKRARVAPDCPFFSPGNRLLATLPPDVMGRLAPELETVPLRAREVVQRIGRQAEHVYFPHSGMGSIVVRMQGGVNVEAATVGNEGVLGISYVLGDALATEETIMRRLDALHRRMDRLLAEPVGRRFTLVR